MDFCLGFGFWITPSGTQGLPLLSYSIFNHFPYLNLPQLFPIFQVLFYIVKNLTTNVNILFNLHL